MDGQLIPDTRWPRDAVDEKDFEVPIDVFLNCADMSR